MGIAYLIPGMAYVADSGAAPPPPPPPGGDCPTVAQIAAAVWDPANALAVTSALRQLADDGVATYDRVTDSLQATRDNSPTVQNVIDALTPILVPALVNAVVAELHARTA